MSQTCKFCMYSVLKTQNDGTIKRFCRGEGDGVGDTHTCNDFSDKQCTMCYYEKLDVLDEVCGVCALSDDKPLYRVINT